MIDQNTPLYVVDMVQDLYVKLDMVDRERLFIPLSITQVYRSYNVLFKLDKDNFNISFNMFIERYCPPLYQILRQDKYKNSFTIEQMCQPLFISPLNEIFLNNLQQIHPVHGFQLREFDEFTVMEYIYNYDLSYFHCKEICKIPTPEIVSIMKSKHKLFLESLKIRSITPWC